MNLLHLLADQGQDSYLPPWVQYGVLGLVFVGLLTKQLVLGWQYTDAKSESAELKEENKRLVQLVLDTQHEAIPALAAAARVTEEAMTEIRGLRGRSG